MKTDNELIAEFMGLEHKGGDVKIKQSAWPKMFWTTARYDTSWDWLMPVVQKIESLMPHINIPADLEALKNGTHGSEPHIEVLSLSIASKISEVYAAVITFIRWFNQQQK